MTCLAIRWCNGILGSVIVVGVGRKYIILMECILK